MRLSTCLRTPFFLAMAFVTMALLIATPAEAQQNGLRNDPRSQNPRSQKRREQEAELDRLFRSQDRTPQPGQTVSDDNVQLGGKGGTTDWSFPASPDRWINSPPLSAESLAGKGIVLLFFEEECPACAARWRDVQRLSSQYTDRPVLFIAVNSGGDQRSVAAYVRQQRVAWPVIVDTDRSFESSLGMTQVSMDNVIQARYITADGAAHPGKWSDLAGTAQAALEGAKWRVDPPAPKELKDAWLAIELGDYARSAKAVTRANKGKEGSTKDFATKLLAAVTETMNADFAEAGTAYGSGKFWQAHQQLTALTKRYDGYELPSGVKPAIKKLAKRADVAAEFKALKSLDKARRTASKGSDSARRRAIGMLERLVASSPGTEAASEAQEILAGLR